MKAVSRVFCVLALAAILPACKDGGRQGPSTVELVNQMFPPLDPGAITVSVQNNDQVYYNLSIRELESGIIQSEIALIWPVPIASAGGPGHTERSWIFREDTATRTHTIVIYDAGTSALIDEKPFVKGAVPITVFTTIASGTMSLQVSP